MIQAIFVGSDKNLFVELEHVLNQHSITTNWTDTGNSALDLLTELPYTDNRTGVLLITDETLDDMSGRELIEQAITQSPMTNCAPISSLPSKKFHEVFEGLGVLMALPEKPKAEDGQALVDHLHRIAAL
ncbi:MAG: hypothetical protein MI747_24545 [Desulfobacterales bacterium]|nr:hypothetical protein [Desulfobacterales bacterium]